MDIFAVLTLFGGLALFLFGMTVMSAKLEKLAGGSLERIIGRMTSNRFFALLLGCAVTMAIQSSSAMTVMLVGLVNSGIMKLSQSIGVIMGANIGTTVTAWLLSMIGLESDNVILKLLKPDSLSAILAFIGIVLLTFARSDRKKDAGGVMLGFSVLMFGMNMMSGAVKPLANVPEFQNALTMFTNPLLGIAAGMLITAVIQSSSASVGILQALTLTGGITYAVALPIILGQNIGTCVTSLLSSIGANKNARRVAAVHVWFNVIGSALFFAGYMLFRAFSDGLALNSAASPFGIAVMHSVFNVTTTIILLPFTKLLEKLAVMTVPDRKADKAPLSDGVIIPDERLLLSPSFAVAECSRAVSDMAAKAVENIGEAIENLREFSDEREKAIEKREEVADSYEDSLGSYLVRLSSKSLTAADSSQASLLLHAIGDLERISDHAVNLSESAREINDKHIVFSAPAKSEISALSESTLQICAKAVKCFNDGDGGAAYGIAEDAESIRGLCSIFRAQHIERLRKGECTIESGFVFSDLLSSLSRVADHCSDIAECVAKSHCDGGKAPAPSPASEYKRNRLYDLYYLE